MFPIQTLFPLSMSIEVEPPKSYFSVFSSDIILSGSGSIADIPFSPAIRTIPDGITFI